RVAARRTAHRRGRRRRLARPSGRVQPRHRGRGRGTEPLRRGDRACQSVIIGIVFVSLLVTPSMIARAKYIAGFSVFMPRTPLRKAIISSSDSDNGSEPEDTRKRVVIAGFGPVGR